MEDDRARAEAWWRTSIIEMRPGIIRYRGYAIEDLIGHVSFSGMIWLMLRGDLPSEGQAGLLDTALMSAVDHGPQAPQHCDRPHGHVVRRRAQQRDGVGGQCAG